MAGKISDETKRAIIRAYTDGGKSKTQIAREYEVSVSSVSRFINEDSAKEKTLPIKGKPKQAKPHGSNKSFRNNSAPAPGSEPAATVFADLEKILSGNAEILGELPMEYLVQEFVNWISRRDKGEKELISLEMAIESLKLEKSSIEEEISRLGSKAGSLEILIGRMKRLAEDSHMDLSLVEERLANIEQKLSIDHDILLIGSAIRTILRGQELDEELVSMIADMVKWNTSGTKEKKDLVRKALAEYSQFFGSRISPS